jgi:hypothetical protein
MESAPHLVMSVYLAEPAIALAPDTTIRHSVNRPGFHAAVLLAAPPVDAPIF